MIKLNKKQHQKVLDIYLKLNTHELAHLINMARGRVTIPVGHDDGVEMQTMAFACLNGACIEIITEEFEQRLDEERSKRVDELLKDNNDGPKF